MTTLSEAKDICQGCYSIKRKIYCGFMNYSTEEKCPCINCLVKVVCENRCDSRNNINNAVNFQERE